jgi:hypothetical protein
MGELWLASQIVLNGVVIDEIGRGAHGDVPRTMMSLVWPRRRNASKPPTMIRQVSPAN